MTSHSASKPHVTKSALMLCIHLVVCCAIITGAFVFRARHLHLWPCSFYHITGLYCLTCGSTRAVYSLLNFDFATALFWNPFPILLMLLMLFLIGRDIRGIVMKRYAPFSKVGEVVIVIVSILFVFCVLRNVGVIALPAIDYSPYDFVF